MDTPGRSVGGRTQVFASLCAMVFLVNLGRLVYAPLLEPFRAAFDANTAQLGLLATLAWIGSAAPRLPTGYLLTRYPRHTVVLWSGAVLTASSAFAATAWSLRVLYVGALLMGLASGVYFVAANPLVSELFPDRVGRVIGVHGVASQVAAVVAPAFVGVVLVAASSRFGSVLAVAAGSRSGSVLAVQPDAEPWRLVFVLIALAAAASTTAFYVLARRTVLPESGLADRRLLDAFRANWRLVATAVALAGLVGLVWTGLFNLYVTYLATKDISEGVALTLLTVMFATGVPAFWLTGSLADRVPFVPLLLAIVGAFAICLFALTAVRSVAAVAVVSTVTGYVIHGLFPVSDTYVLASTPDEHRGSAYAIFSAAMMPLHAVGPVVVGGLVGFGADFDAVFRGFGLALVALVVGLWVLSAAGRLPAGANG